MTVIAKRGRPLRLVGVGIVITTGRVRISAPSPEPFVRDPESWQAVAAAGRKYA